MKRANSPPTPALVVTYAKVRQNGFFWGVWSRMTQSPSTNTPLQTRGTHSRMRHKSPVSTFSSGERASQLHPVSPRSDFGRPKSGAGKCKPRSFPPGRHHLGWAFPYGMHIFFLTEEKTYVDSGALLADRSARARATLRGSSSQRNTMVANRDNWWSDGRGMGGAPVRFTALLGTQGDSDALRCHLHSRGCSVNIKVSGRVVTDHVECRPPRRQTPLCRNEPHVAKRILSSGTK